MAGTRKSFGSLIATLLLGVGLLHLAALWWLAQQLQHLSILQAMPAPLFTRTLTPSATPARLAHPHAAPVPHPAGPSAKVAVAQAAAPQPVAPAAAAASAPAAPASATPAAPASATPPALASAAPEPLPTASAAAITPPVSPALAASPAAQASVANAQPQADSPDSWPLDTRVQYRVSGNYRGPISGDAQVQWQRDAQRYQIQISIQLAVFFKMSMTSQGKVLAQELWPERYEEVTVNKTVRTLTLDPTELWFGGGRHMVRPPGVQDTASQFVELTHRFSQAPDTLAAGRTVNIWLARPGGADPWVYDIVGPETLSTPHFGPIETYHLKPRPLAVPRGPITAELWFAPQLQYLPVRIRITMDADTWLDLQMTQIDQAAPKPRQP